MSSKLSSLALLTIAICAFAADPTHVDVKCGPYDRNMLDLWLAKSSRPAPLVVFIHGGGFVADNNNKAHDSKLVAMFLDAGVSYASRNNRSRTEAPIRDVLRESTRLSAAGAIAPQASYDLERWPHILGVGIEQFQKVTDEVPSFYGFKNNDALYTPEGKRVRADVDILGLITKDDPPVYVSSSLADTPPKDRAHANHHPRHSMAIKNRCDEIGAEAVIQLGGRQTRDGDSPALAEFLSVHLAATGNQP